MNKRFLEFFIVLIVVACAAAFLLKDEAKPPDELVETEPLPMPSSSATPYDTVVYTAAALDDFRLAKGLEGYEETLQTPILEPSQARIEKGAELFQANCALCHGRIGKGDGEGGASLDPTPSNLTQPDEYKYGHRELGLFRSAKYGVEGTGMAPWEGILPDEELWCITYYVQFLQEDN